MRKSSYLCAVIGVLTLFASPVLAGPRDGSGLSSDSLLSRGWPGEPANTDPMEGLQIRTTDVNYPKLLERSHTTPVMLMFSGDKCCACGEMLPFVKDQNEKDNSWIWAYTNTNRTKIRPANWQGNPTLVLMWKGKEVDRQLGFCDEAYTRAAIARMLTKAKALVASEQRFDELENEEAMFSGGPVMMRFSVPDYLNTK